MDSAGLKLKLLDKLVSVEDDTLLKKIEDIIGEVNIEASPLKLTDSQKQMLNASEEDIFNQRLTSDDDVNNEEDKWLSE